MNLAKFHAYRAAPDKKTERRLLNELIAENEQLIHKLVHQCFVKTLSFTEEEDLYQVGMLAFCMALKKFEPEKYSRKGLGASFCTYLAYWVRAYCKRDAIKQQTIKYPEEDCGMPYSVHKKSEYIKATTGEYATAEQLGSYTLRVKGKTKTIKITDELLLSWRAMQSAIVPLDSAQEENTPPTLRCPDSSKTPEALFLNAEREQEMTRILSLCTPSERTVVTAIRNGEGSDRKVSQLLGLKEQAARAYKARLVAKLARIAERTT